MYMAICMMKNGPRVEIYIHYEQHPLLPNLSDDLV